MAFYQREINMLGIEEDDVDSWSVRDSTST